MTSTPQVPLFHQEHHFNYVFCNFPIPQKIIGFAPLSSCWIMSQEDHISSDKYQYSTGWCSIQYPTTSTPIWAFWTRLGSMWSIATMSVTELACKRQTHCYRNTWYLHSPQGQKEPLCNGGNMSRENTHLPCSCYDDNAAWDQCALKIGQHQATIPCKPSIC